MQLTNKDKNEIIQRYSERYRQYGYSPITLGWIKGKQDIRFDVLTSLQDLSNKSILDIGCGFGDLNITLKNKFDNYYYLGMDIVPDLITEAKRRYLNKNINFLCGDFLENLVSQEFDFAIASGIFNFKLKEQNNYSFIENVIREALSICREGIAFDFLSDKVDFKYKHTFHSSPEKILKIAYKYSRNIVLRNDYMPFEFALYIFKDDSFEISDTVFNKHKKR
jgi:ubiquinone/menaquinone biosynthesis C-methylase UbiE